MRIVTNVWVDIEIDGSEYEIRVEGTPDTDENNDRATLVAIRPKGIPADVTASQDVMGNRVDLNDDLAEG